MRYWLLRRPPHYTDINPTHANKPWEYDKVCVNVHLKAGDVVYLTAAYDELYGWGYVDKRESYHDGELERRAYRVTVTRPVVQQNIRTGDEIKRTPELAELFRSSEVTLLELKANQVSAFNGLLRSKGFVAPSNMEEDELAPSTLPKLKFPRLRLKPGEEVWLKAAYERLNEGKKHEPRELYVALLGKIPQDFEYERIDRRLVSDGELTLLGILHVDPASHLVRETDLVINFNRELIKKGVTSATSEQVSEDLSLPEEHIALIFGLIRGLGHFWNGLVPHTSFAGYSKITFDAIPVVREYLNYSGLGPLLEKLGRTGEEKQPPAQEESKFVHSLLDWKLAERLEDALIWTNGLPAEDVTTYDTEHLTKAVERFAIAPPILSNKPVRDETIAELEDLAADRKTGSTGHIFLVSIEGDPEWFQEINMQRVETDGHPLAFLDKRRGWIYVKLQVSLDDPEGSLRRKLDERLALVAEYGVYLTERIVNFNRQLADKMTEDLNKRKRAIQRGKAEADALNLDTTFNPKRAERAIQIDRLMENLSARFTNARSQPLLSDENRTQRMNNEMSDLHQDALTIAKYMYENRFVGSRGITLRELRENSSLSEEAFETADEYLLEAKLYDGTMGGDAGQRWLTPSGVSFVRTEDAGGEPSADVVERGQTSSLDVFISHSSKDIDIAKALIRLLRNALNIPADRIRCTSVDGYRLRVGAPTNDQLRTEVRESRVFLGLITITSIESTYVLFELGARWGANLQLAPVLISSGDKGLLRGPLGAFNALACDSASQVFQLVEDVAHELGLRAASPSSYQDYVDSVVAASQSAAAPQSPGPSPRPKEFDFERMAKHVTNHFAAKRFTRIGFESLRQHVNESYSDQLLFEMIDRFPDQFRRVTLKGKRPAVGLVQRAEVNQKPDLEAT